MMAIDSMNQRSTSIWGGGVDEEEAIDVEDGDATEAGGGDEGGVGANNSSYSYGCSFDSDLAPTKMYCCPLFVC